MDDMQRAEYASLRKEISDCTREASLAIAVMVAALGTVFSYAVLKVAGDDVPQVTFCALLALALIVFAATIVGVKRRTVWRLSSYIMIFIENVEPKMGWETRANNLPRFLGEEPRLVKDLSADRTTFTADRVLFVLVSLLVMAGYFGCVWDNGLRFNQHDGLQSIVLVSLCSFATFVYVNGIFESLRPAGPVHSGFFDAWLELYRQERSRPVGLSQRRVA